MYVAGLHMLHYSVLIPTRDTADQFGRHLPQLCQVLDDLLLPYEILCIDDASAQPAVEHLQKLLAENARLRLLRFDTARGVSAALTAGLAASRGRIILAMDARDAAAAHDLPQLISRLGRHDLAIARRQRPLWREAWLAVLFGWRLLTGRPDLRAGEDLLWAANRAALESLTLSRGAFRCLPALVVRRRLAACRVVLAEGLLPRCERYQPSLLERIAAWWHARRFEPHLAREIRRDDTDGGQLPPEDGLPRLDVALPRSVPQLTFQPFAKKPRDNA